MSLTPTLLIVDDHSGFRNLLVDFLRLTSIRCVQCDNPLDVVNLYREHKPAWVAMDIEMPILNGFEATRLLRKSFPSARVVILTQFDETRFRDESIEAGAEACLSKQDLESLKLLLQR